MPNPILLFPSCPQRCLAEISGSARLFSDASDSIVALLFCASAAISGFELTIRESTSSKVCADADRAMMQVSRVYNFFSLSVPLLYVL